MFELKVIQQKKLRSLKRQFVIALREKNENIRQLHQNKANHNRNMHMQNKSKQVIHELNQVKLNEKLRLNEKKQKELYNEQIKQLKEKHEEERKKNKEYIAKMKQQIKNEKKLNIRKRKIQKILNSNFNNGLNDVSQNRKQKLMRRLFSDL